MLTKRIIACLDVKDGRVVKGVQFRNHVDMGCILELSKRYADEGVDELVFYDITASSDGRVVDKSWVNQIARRINIPFCVAGGIRTIADAKAILNDGADKISVNSPALEGLTLFPNLLRHSAPNVLSLVLIVVAKVINCRFINILAMKLKLLNQSATPCLGRVKSPVLVPVKSC